MSYYDRNHKKLGIKNLKYLNRGGCAKIYSNGEVILKKYYPYTIPRSKLTEGMFDILSDINNPHFVELLNIYKQELLFNKKNNQAPEFRVDAYTAKYYHDDKVNVLEEHKDYLLDNLREIEELFEIFTDNMIWLDDIKKDNTILTTNNIVVIDPDLYKIYQSSKEYLSRLNKIELIKLITSIMVHDLKPNGICTMDNLQFINSYIFKSMTKGPKNITDEFSKKLEYVKRPIELFNK